MLEISQCQVCKKTKFPGMPHFIYQCTFFLVLILKCSCRPTYHHNYIFPSFPSVSLHLSCHSRLTYGHDFWYVKVLEPEHRTIARCEVCACIYMTYISVSKSTPLAVTGPHGQLASLTITETSRPLTWSPSCQSEYFEALASSHDSTKGSFESSVKW